MGDGLREREELRDLFGRHVGEDVARAAQERGIELGGEELEVAVLFVDLVGSTSMAAERPPQEVVAMLNEFFGVVVEVVEDHGGWINKFEGDAALAVFGAPLPLDDAAGCALAAGRTLAERIGAGLEGLEAGIGVSAGRAVAGNVGRGVALRVHGDRRPGQRGRAAVRAGQGGRRARARVGGGRSSARARRRPGAGARTRRSRCAAAARRPASPFRASGGGACARG